VPLLEEVLVISLPSSASRDWDVRKVPRLQPSSCSFWPLFRPSLHQSFFLVDFLVNFLLRVPSFCSTFICPPLPRHVTPGRFATPPWSSLLDSSPVTGLPCQQCSVCFCPSLCLIRLNVVVFFLFLNSTSRSAVLQRSQPSFFPIAVAYGRKGTPLSSFLVTPSSLATPFLAIGHRYR